MVFIVFIVFSIFKKDSGNPCFRVRKEEEKQKEN